MESRPVAGRKGRAAEREPQTGQLVEEERLGGKGQPGGTGQPGRTEEAAACFWAPKGRMCKPPDEASKHSMA